MDICSHLDLASSLPGGSQTYGWHMHDHGYMFAGNWGWYGWFIHMIFWLLVISAIVAATLLIARGYGRKGSSGSGTSAIELLDQRYAKGEIDREEYLQRKRDIQED